MAQQPVHLGEVAWNMHAAASIPPLCSTTTTFFFLYNKFDVCPQFFFWLQYDFAEFGSQTFATLGKKTTCDVQVFLDLGIPCWMLLRNAWEFVVTFLRSYHCVFSHDEHLHSLTLLKSFLLYVAFLFDACICNLFVPNCTQLVELNISCNI